MKSMKPKKPKKKAAGAAKRKTSTPAKKKTYPAKAPMKEEKSFASQEPILTITITPEQIKEWEKETGGMKEDSVWPPPTHYKLETFENLLKLPNGVTFPVSHIGKIRHSKSLQRLIYNGVMSKEEKDELLKLSTDAPYRGAIDSLFLKSQGYRHGGLFNRTPRLSSEQQKDIDDFIKNVELRQHSPNKCKTADTLSNDIAEQLYRHKETKLKGDSWATRSETKTAIERWRNAAEDLSDGVEDMLILVKAHGMREPSCKYPKAIVVIEGLGFVGVSPLFNDLLNKLNKLIYAFKYAEKKLENKRGRPDEIFRINFVIKLAIVFEHNFTQPPTTGENSDFHQFLEMVFRWMGIKKSYIHSDVLKALGFIKNQKLNEAEAD